MIRVKVTDEEKFKKVYKIEFDESLEMDEWDRLDGHVYVESDEHCQSSFGICEHDKFEEELGFIFERVNN